MNNSSFASIRQRHDCDRLRILRPQPAGGPTNDVRASTLVVLVLAMPVVASCGVLKRPASEAPATVVKAVPSPVQATAQPEPELTNPPENLVAAGITAYENGNYPEAETKFHAALGSRVGAADQITAHKHLAFIACASKKRSTCEDHFRKALSIDRNFRLSAAEAGHPAWGPVFKKVKAEAAKKTTKR